MGWEAADHKIVFYADYVCIAGCNSIWFQTTMTAIVRMFKREVMHTNLVKTKAVVCTLGFIWGQQGSAANNQIYAG